MRFRRAAVLIALALVAAACSSEEQLNPQPLPPEDESPRSPPAGGSQSDGNLGACSGTCCAKPAEGSACDANADTTCSWAVSCPTGLVIPYEITCTNGVWQLTNGCPAEGTTDSRGCPARQPENGTTCAVNLNVSQCGYVLECTSYRKSAIAQCFDNGTSGTGERTWSTTPLGTCD